MKVRGKVMNIDQTLELLNAIDAEYTTIEGFYDMQAELEEFKDIHITSDLNRPGSNRFLDIRFRVSEPKSTVLELEKQENKLKNDCFW